MIRIKKYFAVMLAALLVVAMSNSPLLFSNDTAQAHAYSGEEVFKGVFFATGDAAELFTEHHHPDVQNHVHTDEEKEVINQITEEMEAIDGSYFDKLEEAIYSENLPVVEEQIEQGGELVTEALKNLDMIVPEGEADAAAVAAGPVAVVAAGVHMYAAASHTAAAAVQVVATIAYWVHEPGNEAATSSLDQQDLVFDIVETLN